MTTVSWSDLVDEAARRLNSSLDGDRRQEARWLVERVSGYSSAELIVNSSDLVGTRSVAFFDALFARRCDGEPLQYVLGRWGFRTLDLFVGPGVLIPRPETEVVAGIAIGAASKLRTPTVVDLGTGCGAIACAVAVEVPSSTVWATDVSEDALSIARSNVAGLGRAGGRITVTQGAWFEALPTELRGAVDVIVSNPPYVAESERVDLAAEILDWEPHNALFAADDGRADVRTVLDGASTWLRPGGIVVVEMAPVQTTWAAEYADGLGFADISVHRDLAGRNRAVSARRPA